MLPQAAVGQSGTYIAKLAMASHSWDGKVVGDTYVRCKVCPLQHNCSSHAWSRAQIWDFTLDDAKKRLSLHLKRSSLHHGDIKDIEEMGFSVEDYVGQCEWEEVELTQSDFDKRARHTAPQQGPSKRIKGNMAELITSAVQSGVHSMMDPLAFASPALRPSPKHRAHEQLTIRGGGGGAGAIRMHGGGGVPLMMDSEITVRTSELKVALDSVWRAHDAASNAQKLCASASTAFGAEVERLQESGQIIAAMIIANTS
jgi:hypothetical protein